MFQASHVQQDPVLALYVTFKEEIILLFPSPNGRKCAPFYLPLVLPYRLRQVETVFHHHKAKKNLTQGQPKVHIPKPLLSSLGHAAFLVYISTFLGIRNRHLN